MKCRKCGQNYNPSKDMDSCDEMKICGPCNIKMIKTSYEEDANREPFTESNFKAFDDNLIEPW